CIGVFSCAYNICCFLFFFSSRRRHTRFSRDWSSDVCSSDLIPDALEADTRDSKTGRLVGIAPMQAHEALVLGRRAGSHPSSLRLRTAELSPPPAACYAHTLHPLREIPIRSTAARPTGRPH